MDNTLQLKQSLLTTIGGIEDRNIILSIYNYVKGKISKTPSKAKEENDDIQVPPEVWAIIKRIHPVNVTDERKEYYEHLSVKGFCKN